MSFSVGSIVRVATIHPGDPIYRIELESYLGKEGEIIGITQDAFRVKFEDDKQLYFRDSWLKPSLLGSVKIQETIVKEYVMDGFTRFKNRREVLAQMYKDITVYFDVFNITPDTIDQQITKLQELKEVCLKLK
jgi:hypothetical protein